jgi:N-terminal acetyltransferase B complex catalytic subunit
MNILEALSGSRTHPAKGVSDGESQDTIGEDTNGQKAVLSNKDAVDAWFVDLFVRCNNERAVEMYERMGYSVYRRVVE